MGINSYDVIFFSPVLLLLAAAIGFGIWRGSFMKGMLVVGGGVIVLGLAYALYLAIYFANGGH